MYIENIYEKGLAQASYIVWCQATKEAILMVRKGILMNILKLRKERSWKLQRLPRHIIMPIFWAEPESFAASIMLSKGYTNVFNVPGGFEEWINEGYEVLKEDLKREAVL